MKYDFVGFLTLIMHICAYVLSSSLHCVSSTHKLAVSREKNDICGKFL